MAMRRIINATGVILHTNAGRAPLSEVILTRAREMLAGYSNLELDVESGERGRRDALITPVLKELTGAEDGLVVNNNAAAVLLALRALGAGRPAAASRGELVEIGGSFRLPDVMAAGGVTLMPVGTVNVTRAEDFKSAVDEGAALIVLAHRSNFYFVGPHEDPPVKDVVAVGRAAGVPVIYDLGSGLLNAGLYKGIIPADEPNVADLLAAGADLVTFSGDKILGGPQAGIVVGTAAAVARLRKDPLYRALRVGKETFALLTATLDAYVKNGDALKTIPVYRLLKRGGDELERMAGEIKAWIDAAGVPGLTVTVEADESLVGGGTLPYLKLPGWVAAARHDHLTPHALSAAFRLLEPPVLARASRDAVRLDPRSILDDDRALLEAACARLRRAAREYVP
jgi:L-seryl-tRNA(Ser) seleniumtransferase